MTTTANEHDNTGTTGGIGIRGTLARPAPSLTLVPDNENETNGLEEVVDWDRLEEFLDSDECRYQTDFKAEVICQFEEAGEPFTRGMYDSVKAGLFPEYREKYNALNASLSKGNSVLDADLVREIRKRAENGEALAKLAREVGVKRATVSDLVNRKTWKDVA